MTPRSERIAYQIWAYAEPRGWDVTIGELSEATGESASAISAVLLNKGWLARVRKMRLSHKIGDADTNGRTHFMDAAIDYLERWQ